MNRDKLTENILQLNDTEVAILKYVTREPPYWFKDPSVPDSEIKRLLNTAFQPYFTTDESNNPHPIMRVYDKVLDNVDLFPVFDKDYLKEQSKSFQALAKSINNLCMSDVREQVIIILKAIAQRDFDSIHNYYRYPDSITLDVFLQNFEEFYIDDVAKFLHENDLKLIMEFCYKDI